MRRRNDRFRLMLDFLSYEDMEVFVETHLQTDAEIFPADVLDDKVTSRNVYVVARKGTRAKPGKYAQR